MAERPEAAPEGWSVRHRPAVIAALAVPFGLIALLSLAGWFYDRDLRPDTRRPVIAFSAPGLETFIHDGVRDPRLPQPRHVTDPGIAAAKRGLVAGGLAGWERQH